MYFIFFVSLLDTASFFLLVLLFLFLETFLRCICVLSFCCWSFVQLLYPCIVYLIFCFGLYLFSLFFRSPQVTDISFSSRGDLLASAGDDGVVRLWDTSIASLMTNPFPTVRDMTSEGMFHVVSCLSLFFLSRHATLYFMLYHVMLHTALYDVSSRVAPFFVIWYVPHSTSWRSMLYHVMFHVVRDCFMLFWVLPHVVRNCFALRLTLCEITPRYVPSCHVVFFSDTIVFGSRLLWNIFVFSIVVIVRCPVPPVDTIARRPIWQGSKNSTQKSSVFASVFCFIVFSQDGALFWSIFILEKVIMLMMLMTLLLEVQTHNPAL